MAETVTDRVVSIFLKFGADQQSIEKSIASFKKIQTELVALEQNAKSLRSDISSALEHGEDVTDLTTELKTVEAAIGNLKRKADTELAGGLNSSFDKVAQKAQQTGASLSQSFNLRDIGEKLNQVGQTVSNVGRGLTSTLMGAVNAYLATSNQFSREAQRWNTAQKQMQDAYARIGAVALDKLTPYIEKAADLLEKVASFIEENPWVVEAVAGMAAAATVGGQFISGVAQLAMFAGSIQGLTKILGTGQVMATLGKIASGVGGGLATAGKGLLGFATGVGGAVTGGVAAGLGGYELLARSDAGKKAGLANLGQYASVAAYGLGKLFDEKTAMKWFKSMGEMTGVIEKQAKAATSVVDNSEMKKFADKNIEVFRRYEEEKKDATEQYAKQAAKIEQDAANARLMIIKNFSERVSQLEENYARDKARAEFDFQQSQIQADQDYYRQRSEAERNFAVEMQRAAEDHKRDMQNLERDHNSRVKDLVAARDAYGLVKENDSYNQERQDAEDKYRTDINRRKQDYAQQMTDMAASYALQRSQRIKEFAAQQIERQQQFSLEMSQLQKDKEDQLAELKKSTSDQLTELKNSYALQMDVIEKSFGDQLKLLVQRSGEGLTSANNLYLAELDRFVEEVKKRKLFGTDQRANGGPVSAASPYVVGEYGPELFVPRRDGSIIPAGLTSSLLSSRRMDQTARQMMVKIESSSLTMNEIISEMDKRFGAFEREFSNAFA